VIYTIMIVILIWLRTVCRPRRAVDADMTAQTDVGYHSVQHGRWRASEIAFWLLALAIAFLFPSR